VEPSLLSLDIYAPTNADGLPVMVCVHGGGWQRGDKANVEPLVAALNREGYVFVSANYRLAPDAPFPAWPDDVAAAIAWAHEHIAKYGGNPDQVCLMGHSAGAHLVALVGTDETYLAKRGLTLADISAVLPLDTQAYDIPALAERLGETLPAAYRVPFTDDRQLWAAASPIAHVEPGKQIPPMIIPYSGGLNPRRANAGRAEAARQFAEALRQAGTTAEVVPAPEKTHAQIARQFGADGDHVAEAVLAFLRRVLATASVGPG
jgi:arylformamidase